MTEEEKQNQFAEIFPDGKIIKHHWDPKEAKRRLKAVLAAVFSDDSINFYNLEQMSGNTRAALYTLHSYTKPAPTHQTGLVFDARLYEIALKFYTKKYPSGGSIAQYKFWCVRIEEYLAACLGTGYLRPHTQGIGYPAVSTGCVLANNTSYFAFRRSHYSVPGYHFWVDRSGCQSDQRPNLIRHDWVWQNDSYTRRGFSRQMADKKAKRTECMRRYSQQRTTTCTIS